MMRIDADAGEQRLKETAMQDRNAFANRVAEQLETHPIESRGAALCGELLVAFGMDTEPQAVVTALRESLADEPICKELGFATSGATWAMILEATEMRNDLDELCDALNELVWLAWLDANGREAVPDAGAPRADAAAKVLHGLRSKVAQP
jgi:hypothetical protein